ncbi:hypothetical protein CLF_106243 [Clonorchis sinensis]|uniref:Uncharacterized protein n=1 Tax=Clonorchis sinensis TaxID=79923 RepID=G7YEV5_CLOSI|nr:hypothetical protein CLF_106243 [Clonorchis sinensis]
MSSLDTTHILRSRSQKRLSSEAYTRMPIRIRCAAGATNLCRLEVAIKQQVFEERRSALDPRACISDHNRLQAYQPFPGVQWSGHYYAYIYNGCSVLLNNGYFRLHEKHRRQCAPDDGNVFRVPCNPIMMSKSCILCNSVRPQNIHRTLRLITVSMTDDLMITMATSDLPSSYPQQNVPDLHTSDKYPRKQAS